MPPKRMSARASTGPTPVRVSSRTTRSRATPLADGPSPYTAQRGYMTNSYGDEERQPIPSGVADINAAKGFAAEMQAKINEAQEQRAARASRALSNSLAQTRSPSVQRTPISRNSQSVIEEESEQDSEIRSSASRRSERSRNSRARSISISRSEQEEEDETLPSGGLGSITRHFDDYYEAGLELPARLPGLPKISDLLGVDWEDLFWAAVYIAPLVPLLLLTIALGPLMSKHAVSTAFSVKDMIHLPTFHAPSVPEFHWPAWKPGMTQTITVAQITKTITSTSTSTPYRYGGSDSRTMNEINRMRTEMEVMRDRMNHLELQVAAPHKPNFFSPTLGAFISQQFTSPTRKQGTTLGTRAYFAFFKEFVPPPPIAALRPWTENGDCWCGAEAAKGQLSIGINLGRDVYPEHLTVEHISRSDALDISSAPRRLDMWARSASEHAFNDIPAAWRNNKQCESPSPDAKDPRWLCMGMLAYDIELADTAQSRSLDSYGVMPPFKISNAVVRVLENHGQKYTCVYRLKLAGRVDSDQSAGVS